jgi:cytochrome c-type biogenesis protein CcmI
MIYPVLILSLLVTLAFLFIFAPMLAGQQRQRKEQGRARLEAEKQNLIQLLRDLEFDHRTGKLSDPDYRAAREEAESRAISVLVALETIQSEWTRPALEAEIGRMRERLSRRSRRA